MSVEKKNVPDLYNGHQVVMYTDAKKVRNIKGHADLPSIESWYREDPTNNHLGMQKLFGNQKFTPGGIFPELLQNKDVLEVNGLDGTFTYDIAIEEDEGCYTTRDYSYQDYPGVDDSTFKIVLNEEFTAGDILSNDPEYGQDIIVQEVPVMNLGDGYEHTVKLVTNDKTEWFMPSNLAKGITYFKLSHAIFGEYGTNYSKTTMPSQVGKMRCEFTLGNVKGVEAYVTGAADKKSFSGAAASTKDYLNKLEQEVAKKGELAVMMDVNKKGETLTNTMRIGSTMQMLVFRELERLTAQQLLFQRAATFKDSNGVTRLNEGLWHQLRRGKIISYARPGGITRTHIKDAVEYIFRVNPHLQDAERRIKFKCGTEAYNNVLEIFSEEVKHQLNNLGQAGFMGSDRVIPNPVSGDNLMELQMKPIRFTKVFIPGIGNLEIERDTNLDFNILNTDRFARGMHQYNKAHSTHSMIVWDAEDAQYSNNSELPKGTQVVEGGRKDANIYLVKPEGDMMYWGYSNGRYSISKAGDIVSSHKQIGQEFWAWNSVAIHVRDITKFVMIELDPSARKGFN